MNQETPQTSTPIHDNQMTTGFETAIEKFSIVGRDNQTLARTIKE